MKNVDVYWSFRSPYSYLATRRLRTLADRWSVRVVPKPVYPIAIRDPHFFEEIRPQWVPYLLRDVARLSQQLGLPMGRPNPDPVVMNMMTREISAEQPYIARLTRLGSLACEAGDEKGWAFLDEVSTLIWSGAAWTEGDALAEAVARAGLDLSVLDAQQDSESARIAAVIAKHQEEQAAYHWGVPLMVFDGEPFYGQDRIDALEWRLGQAGVARK